MTSPRATCKGHQADIGGALAGGYNPNAREVWQEALRIPPVKVYEKGRLRKDVWNLIFANIRFAIVQEDIKAEVGACTVGERGVHAILDRYGREPFSTHMESLLDATEQMMRREIRAIPDGTYRGESIVFYDGVRKGSRYRIVVTVTVRGDGIWSDYHGPDPPHRHPEGMFPERRVPRRDDLREQPGRPPLRGDLPRVCPGRAPARHGGVE